ncbi:Uncharacterised protein [Buttiauxella agrestis]|uniref:Helix-turn-helix domain-containing protein n=1 Tax=Buttiauxella agrestis TaxID=82977 RepID=A0A381C5Z8_9ENTR|nr:helix-turn-helix domain-containing protein [Buttiauxella agrestis]SUW63270.1 Uncharacterised protein [Buttiauxella agrestis]
MSVKLSAYVWDGCAAAGIKGNKLLIMLRLADFASDEGIAYPSVATIARQLGAGRSTVISLISELEKGGWLVKKERRQGQRNTSNLYTLNVTRLRHAAAGAYSDSPIPERSEVEHPETERPDFERPGESEKAGSQGPEIGHDPSVNSKPDPSDLKPVGQSPLATDPQQPDSLKIDYPAVLEAYHTTLPEMPTVLDMTDDRRKKLRSLWKKYDFNLDRWQAYLRYIAKYCRWMMENRPDTTTGKTWRKKNFDYLVTEKCYLAVKEERANDLPKVARVDITERDTAFVRLVAQGKKPAGRVEELAKAAAGKAGLGRMNEVMARASWKSIWTQAVTQASEEDLARIAS